LPTRPCRAEIDLFALAHNLQRLQRVAANATLAAIVKSDAYGHSLALCAPAAFRAGAQWLAVTSTDEALAAVRACSREPGFSPSSPRILVLSGPFSGDGEAVASHGFTCSVWQRDQLEELQRGARATARTGIPIHLEIDTGMNRQGVAADDLAALLSTLHAFPALGLDGIMTHLYAADEGDHLATDQQLQRLETSLLVIGDWVATTGADRPTWLSVGSSAALLDGSVLERLTAMSAAHRLRLLLRPGLALYGIAPEFDPLPGPDAAMDAVLDELRTVLRWTTRITALRHIAAGEVVGYNGSFRASQPMRLALVAAGYADGLSRLLSDRGHALVAGQQAPYAGRISMDQAVLDVTAIPEERVGIGDEVVLLGSQGQSSVTAQDHARWAETIPWEVFTSISSRVARFAKP
jgi:alanine racemase